MTEAAGNLPRDGVGNVPLPSAGEGGGGGLLERILLAAAVGLLGLVVLDFLRALLPQMGQVPSWLWMLNAIVLLTPVAVLLPAVIRPRSIVAAVVASLPVGFLVMLGETFTPMLWQRFAIHIAAILTLAAVVVRVIRGIAHRRSRELWIVPVLLFGFPVGYLAAGLLGFHIREYVCGPEILSILCSG